MHTTGHVREAFEEVAESGLLWEEDLSLSNRLDVEATVFNGQPLSKLLGKLWNSTDCMPANLRQDVRDAFEMNTEPVTYAQAAQRIRRQLRR